MRLAVTSLLAALALPLSTLGLVSTGTSAGSGGSAASTSRTASSSRTAAPSSRTAASSPHRPYIAYSPDSFLKSKVTGAPVNHRLTRQFHHFMATDPEQAGTSYPTIHGVDGNQWGMPYAMAHCSNPVWKFGNVSGHFPSQWRRLKRTGFHAPANLGSRLTGTNDSPFVVIDRCDHLTIWGENAKKAGRRVLDVSTFGVFDDSSNGLDGRNPASNDPKNFRSRGVIPDSMLIRKDEMRYAVAHHTDLGQVLELFFVETNGSGHPCYTNPMVGCEQRHTGWGTEGTRIAVSPTVNLSKRRCSPQARAIARTLQDYGGYIGDNSGSTTGIKAEQGWPGHSVWHGTLNRDELKGCISWKDFVVIRPGWG